MIESVIVLITLLIVVKLYVKKKTLRLLDLTPEQLRSYLNVRRVK